MKFTSFSTYALLSLLAVSLVNAQKIEDDLVPRPGDDRLPGPGQTQPGPGPVGDDRGTPRVGDDNPSRTRNGTSSTPTNSTSDSPNSGFTSSATGALSVVGLLAAFLV